MSTRSGKRLHNSFNEDNIKIVDELAVKSERKTRSKALKENIRDLSTSKTFKKRKNYVRYPSDDESTEVHDVEGDKNISTKLKNTLKEKNINTPTKDDFVESSNKNLRTTRRTKKLLDNEKEIIQESDNHVTKKTAEKLKSKKNKKKKLEEVLNENEIPKPKSKKKKGRKSGSLVVEDIVPHQEKNDSLDSFYSAAGSPAKELRPETNIHNLSSPESKSRKDIWIPESKKDCSNPNIIFDNQDSTENEKLKSSQKNNQNSRKSSNNSFIAKTNDTTYEKDEINKDLVENISTKNISLINISGPSINVNMNTTYEKDTDSDNEKQNVTDINKRKLLDTTFETGQIVQITKTSSKKKKSLIQTPTDKEASIRDNNTNFRIKSDEVKRKSLFNNTYEKENLTNEDLNKSVIENNKSSVKDTTFDKDNDCTTENKISAEKNRNTLKMKNNSLIQNSTVDKHSLTCNRTNKTHRNSNINDTTFDKSNSSLIDINNVTFEKKNNNITQQSRAMDVKNNCKDQDKFSFVYSNTAVESLPNILYLEDSNVKSATKRHKKDTTFEVENVQSSGSNDIYDMDQNDKVHQRKETLLQNNDTSQTDKDFNEKNTNKLFTSDFNFQKEVSDITLDMKLDDKPTKNRKSILEINSTKVDVITEKPNDNFIIEKTKRKSSTPVDELKLNETFEKCSKSSLISSDGSTPNVDDKSPMFNNISNISITSDDSEKIVNTTPVLIESSVDESLNNSLHTPLKREGTFTKDSAIVTDQKSPKLCSTTPEKQISLPSAGCTPFHPNRSKTKSMMNLTRSIEKERSSGDLVPRVTKVMFCSPTFDPVAASHQKKKIIKSNLKGSNKSFVYEESALYPRAAPRKRSYTQSDADDTRVKRSRPGDCQQNSVDRLSRPRTSSASAKLTDATTPTKRTPQKAKSESKVTRTKLPNFAALHQKQFDQMESLDECQKRKAKRAKQLLTPTGNIDVMERISPKGPIIVPQKPKDPSKPESKKPPTLDSLRSGYSRFGFKLNMENNPFNAPRKVEMTKIPSKILPSLAGSTTRKDIAKQVVMREKSFTDRRANKRHENRTIIKGVRTNRRFELQMKLRNID